MKQLFQVWFVFALTLVSHAQDARVFKPDSVRRQLRVHSAAGAIRIDGRLQERDWANAPSSSRFVMIEPFQGDAPNHDTDVRILQNDAFLYMGIFCRDSSGRKALMAVDFKRDFNFMAHDLVTMSFDGFRDRRNAMAFAVNPYGVQRDYLAFDDLYYDVEWDGLWRVRTARSDSGWTAEVAIPWQTLRYRKTEDSLQTWGFNLYRNRRLTNEVTAFSPFPRSFSVTRMDYAGELSGLQPPTPRTNIRITPYLLTSIDRQTGDPDARGRTLSFKPGGEIKWAVNPNAILDLTFNTDFAQADADRQVNNTTRFSVFFPERRQFFLENSSLFGIGISKNPDDSGGNMRIQPFFSRRIGLDDAGNQLPIDAGARFVHRSSERNYGAMVMRQGASGGYPSTNFLVARFSENFGSQNRIGGLLTVKDNANGNNTVANVDAFFRLGESHSINALGSVSSTSQTGKQGVSAYAQYYYVSNQLKIWWTQSVVSKDYDPQLGFVSRSDVVGTTPGIFWWYRGKRLPFRRWLRAWEPSIFPEFYHQLSTGKLIERTWTIYPVWLNLQNGGFFGYSVNPTYQYLPERFSPLGVDIAPGDYDYNRHLIYASTNPSRKLNLLTIYQGGTYFNGRLRSGDWVLQFAPIPHVSLMGRFNRNRFFDVGDERSDNTVDLYSIEGRFAINPRVQLIGFYQQNSENDSRNYNIRLSIEYRPLSYIYVVFNHREFLDPVLGPRTLDQSIFKLSYLRQF